MAIEQLIAGDVPLKDEKYEIHQKHNCTYVKIL